nr:unnamed protein product [Digitaria exilis]
MRSIVVLILVTLLLTVHIALADEKQSGDKSRNSGDGNSQGGDGAQSSNKGDKKDEGGDGEKSSNKDNGDNGVGPVKNPHCPKPGRGPDPHGDGHGPPKNTECDNQQESPPPSSTPSYPAGIGNNYFLVFKMADEVKKVGKYHAFVWGDDQFYDYVSRQVLAFGVTLLL